MPDVTLKDGTKKSFPYTEVGIANAKTFAKNNDGRLVGKYHADSPTKGDWGMYPSVVSKPDTPKVKKKKKWRTVTVTKEPTKTKGTAPKTSSPGAKEGQYWIPGKGYVPQGSDSHKKDLQDLRTGKRAFVKNPPPAPKKKQYFEDEGTGKIMPLPKSHRKKTKAVSVAEAEREIPKVAGFLDDDHAVSKAKPGKERVKEVFKSPGVKIGTAIGTALGGLAGQYAGRYTPKDKTKLTVAGAVPGGMIGGAVGAAAETLVKKGKRWLKVRKRAKEIRKEKGWDRQFWQGRDFNKKYQDADGKWKVTN